MGVLYGPQVWMSLVIKGPPLRRVGQPVHNSVPKLDAVSGDQRRTARDRLTFSAKKLLTYLEP